MSDIRKEANKRESRILITSYLVMYRYNLFEKRFCKLTVLRDDHNNRKNVNTKQLFLYNIG